MRDLLLRRSAAGPVLLMMLALVSLAYLQHRPGPKAPPGAAHVGSTATSTWSSPPPAARTTTPGLAGSTTSAAEDSSGNPDVEPAGTPVDPTAAAVARDQAEADLFTHACQVARAFLTDFARPGPATTPEQWWAAVAAHLSAAGREAYTGTDPQLVPYTSVTGAVVILPTTDAEHTLIARARTDAGYYQVRMTAVAGQLWVETVSSEASLAGENTQR
jgi:hypothetical protein